MSSIITRTNEKHCKEIKELLSSVNDREIVDIDEDEKTISADILALDETTEKLRMPISDVMLSADLQHDQVLDKPHFVDEYSNRSRVFKEFIIPNIEEMIKDIPRRCNEFELLAVQRLAIIAMTTPMPEETFTQVCITRERMKEINKESRARKQPFEAKYNIEAGALPVISIADYCTGSGKTIMAIMGACVMLCSSKWNELKESYPDILRARIRDPYSGLCKGTCVSKAKLARLAILFVPSVLLLHWKKTAESAVVGCNELYGEDIGLQIWTEETKHSVNEAYNSGKPTIWILEMKSESMKHVRASPDIGYAVRIFDELNTKMSPRNEQPESPVCFTYVTQATIASLTEATVGSPRHPLRLAFGDNYQPMNKCKELMRHRDYQSIDRTLNHFCKLRQFAPPEFLRRLVSKGVQDNMPSGLLILKLKIMVRTLCGIEKGSDMMSGNLSELLRWILKRFGLHGCNVASFMDNFSGDPQLWSDTKIIQLLELEEGKQTSEYAKNNYRVFRRRIEELLNKGLSLCRFNTSGDLQPTGMLITTCCTALLPTNNGALIDIKLNTEESVLSCPCCRKNVHYKDEDVWSLCASEDTAMQHGDKMICEDNLDTKFSERISAISSCNLSYEDAIMEAIRSQVTRKTASRILLCFNFASYSSQLQSPEIQSSRIEEKLSERIQNDISNCLVFNIEKLARVSPIEARKAKATFDDTQGFAVPVIFIINTQKHSKSVQGLDLVRTDLTIIDSVCSLDIKRQAVGRCLRMTPRRGIQKRIPHKRIIVTASNYANDAS